MADLESRMAVTVEGAVNIGAGAIVANVGMSGALVYVEAGVPERSKAVATPALTLETALEVVTHSVAAHPLPFMALIDIYASIIIV